MIFSKRGFDFTKRFRGLQPALRDLSSREAIIDAELVACDEAGMPCFRMLMEPGGQAPLCLWCFDLLSIDGEKIISLPIEERQEQLADLLMLADSPHIQFSGSFDDPQWLLKRCHEMGLEGIVSKRKGSPYRSGPTNDWVKVKTASWRAANWNRGDMFEN
jgi:bifunctional non-homologous end joining protein LigD